MDTRAVVLALCGLLCHQAVSQYNGQQRTDPFATWNWKGWNQTAMPCSNPTVLGEGFDKGAYVHIGRAPYQGNMLPATIQHTNLTHPAVFSFGEQVFGSQTYQVMCGDGAAWQTIQNAKWSKPLPGTAIPVGYLEDGTLLHACRRSMYNIITMGVVDPQSHFCNFSTSSSGNTQGYDYVNDVSSYEILVQP